MSRESPKEKLIADLLEQFRISGTQDNAFDNVAAERLGVNRTDLACLDVITRVGPVTAGEVAAAAGLTTGAVTAVVDRLERAGYARRVRDDADRRRVMIEATPAFVRRAESIWGPIGADWQRMIRRYTVKELALMLEMMRAGNEIEAHHIERIRAQSDRPPQ
jgi:DNA-binding MarR family transcriptional regulator